MSSDISPENEQFIASAVSRGDFRDRFEVLNAGVELLKRKPTKADSIGSGEPGSEPPHNVESLSDLFQGQVSIAALDEIIQLTSNSFPGNVCVEISADPEFPDWPSIVFHVHQEHKNLDIDDVIDRELQWHAQIAKVAPDSLDRLRLLID